MSFRFRRSESVQSAIRRIAQEQVDRLLAEIDDTDLQRDEVVHQVRKRCKKLRGLLRLVRHGLGKQYTVENESIRDAARSLSSLRDAKSMIASYDDLMDHFDAQVNRQSLQSIRQALTSDMHAVDDADANRRIAEFRHTMAQLRGRIDHWTLARAGDESLFAGLAKTYKRSRHDLRLAIDTPDAERFHELRKRIKYHWYHLRLLRNVWPTLMKTQAHVAKDLGDLLGDDHDLAVLRAKIVDAPENFGSEQDTQAFVALLDQRRRQLSRAALPQVQRMLAETPEAFAIRLESYWKIWRT